LSKLNVGSQLTAVGRAHQLGWRPPAEAVRHQDDAVGPS
jgi:hypothetical protein